MKKTNQRVTDEPVWRCLQIHSISSESDEPVLNSHSKNANNNDLVSQLFLHDNSNESYQRSSGKLIAHSISPISALVIPTKCRLFIIYQTVLDCHSNHSKWQHQESENFTSLPHYQPGTAKPQIPGGWQPNTYKINWFDPKSFTRKVHFVSLCQAVYIILDITWYRGHDSSSWL